MNKFLAHFLLATAVSAVAYFDNPPQPDWPTLPAVPDKMPEVKPVAPQPATVLKGDSLYVVQSDDPVQLLAAPSGLVAISEEAGPVKIRGKFADSVGEKVETRTYQKKKVFVVERLQAGSVTLLLVPSGPVVSRVVLSGEPDPPSPVPPPKPVPPTAESPWKNAAGLRVMLVYPAKPGTLTAAQLPIITGAEVRNYVDAHCVKLGTDPQYFFWKTGEDVTGVPAEWQAAYKLVAQGGVVVGNGPNWEKADLPADATNFLNLLKKYQ